MAGADDVYAIGPPSVVLPAVQKFKQELAERCGLKLQPSKSRLFTWEGDLPAGTPDTMPLAGENVEGVFLRGFSCFGCPVGEDSYVTHKLKEVADRILNDARETVELLAPDRQALWSSLRVSINQRFDYWCQLARPSLVRPVAAYLDQNLWKVLETVGGFPIPRARGLVEGGVNCVVTMPVHSLEERPFAEWVVRQPVKLHGAGLRSQEDTCYPAYIQGLEQAAAFMAGLPVLTEVMGGQEKWGEDADKESRWTGLLSSSHQDGVELRAAWAALQQEAQEAAVFLGEVVEGVLADPVEGAGHASSGTTRTEITSQREATRGRLLLRALELHHDREARPVWSWPGRDKLSAAWLLCLPKPETSFSGREFSEAFAALLCLPSPSCAGRVGEQIVGRIKVCKWGDEVVNAKMRGDGLRTRHDAVKLKIKGLLGWAGIPAVCEVFNLFASSIPQAGLSRIERGRRRQGLVPDFKLRGEEQEGDILCELKCMSASNSRYPRNPQPRDGKRAVDRRAEGLTEDYRRKAKEVDWQYCGTPRPPLRSLQGKLAQWQ